MAKKPEPEPEIRRHSPQQFYALLRQVWQAELDESAWGYDLVWTTAAGAANKANRFATTVGSMPEITYLAQTLQKDLQHGFNPRLATTNRERPAYRVEGRSAQSADSITSSLLLSNTSQLGLKVGKSTAELELFAYAAFDLMTFMVTNRNPWQYPNLEEVLAAIMK